MNADLSPAQQKLLARPSRGAVIKSALQTSLDNKSKLKESLTFSFVSEDVCMTPWKQDGEHLTMFVTLYIISL
jgi:hypothetical protein